jgi:hypothetical protein
MKKVTERKDHERKTSEKKDRRSDGRYALKRRMQK